MTTITDEEVRSLREELVRPLTPEELAAVTGGVIETVFQYGDLKVEIWASQHEYGVCTFKGSKGTCTIVQ